ncbi:MAG: hypothetical protein O7C75_07720, partial [Verrucomicrobia bacterium]|nr:hypothetical protein [Verrucomicrobiota bacterium]
SLARKNAKDLVVMGNRSPAFKDTSVLFREAPKFRRDPGLVLVFEKRPNAQDPFCMDPLVIVRRSFFLDAGGSVKAETPGEIAILMTMEASKRSLTVGYVWSGVRHRSPNKSSERTAANAAVLSSLALSQNKEIDMYACIVHIDMHENDIEYR